MRHALAPLAVTLALSIAAFACSSSSGTSGGAAGSDGLGLGAGGSGVAGSSSQGAGGGVATSPFSMQFCAKLTSCNLTAMNCEETFTAIQWPADCQSALLAATCADLAADPAPASLSACFPPCTTPGSAVCNADGTVTECTKSNYYETITCTGACASNQKTWSGTCDVMYMGQQSSNGAPVCWCL